MSKRHDCQYWQVNARHHYRYCSFCGRTQYDYTGQWVDERRLTYIVNKYSKKTEEYDVTLFCGELFEFGTYETWGTAIKIRIGDVVYGPFKNLNQAEYEIDKARASVVSS